MIYKNTTLDTSILIALSPSDRKPCQAIIQDRAKNLPVETVELVAHQDGHGSVGGLCLFKGPGFA